MNLDREVHPSGPVAAAARVQISWSVVWNSASGKFNFKDDSDYRKRTDTPMNILYKSLTITLLAVSIFISGLSADLVRAQRPGGDTLPIIATTASVFRSPHEGIIAAGCSNMIFKPFRAHEVFVLMAGLLGLSYTYADTDDAAPPLENTELTAAMLADLPPALRQNLDETKLELNQGTILAVIDRIQKHAPGTATHLRALVQNFEVERIREPLAEVG